MEIVHEDAGGRRIELHAAPPSGFVELLARTVWGTGAVRYAMRDAADRVQAFRGAHFVALREGAELVGTYVLAPRTLHVAGRAVPALYRTMLAVAPGRARDGLGLLLAREVRAHFLGRAAGPLVLYGFVEAENAASLAVTRRAGHERWGSFVAAPFTRWSPHDDARVEPLGSADVDALAGALQEAHRGELAGDFRRALAAAPCFGIRDRGRLVAAAQVIEHRWRLDSLSGWSGRFARGVLPRLPGVGRLLDPDDLRFAFLGSLHAVPGAERDLVRLLEAILARRRLSAGMIYLQPRGATAAALARGGGMGLLHAMGVRPRVEVLVSTTGLDPDEVNDLRTRPFQPSILDDV